MCENFTTKGLKDETLMTFSVFLFPFVFVFFCLTSLQLKTLHTGKGEEPEIFIKAGSMDDSISCPDVGH